MDASMLRNARIVLEVSCRARPGESVLILVDDPLAQCADALVAAALEIGAVPLVTDIRPFLRSPAYRQGRLLEPLKAALEAADIVIANTADVHDANRADYARLTGDQDMHDRCLNGERRWVYVQPHGMAHWEITHEAAARLRARTGWLLDLLRAAQSGRITTPSGADFTFGLGPGASCVPILGIVPLYGEVAVVPDLTQTHGIFVADGPTQGDVRPAGETDRAPLAIRVEAGRMVACAGDPEQLARLQRFVAGAAPPADAIDEVGILTTSFADNDRYYWSDGTHHHDRVHVALGNNVRRDVVVHGPRHMDCEISRPTISIDGLVIVRDGVFRDAVMGVR